MPTLRERVRLISTLSNERRLGGGDLLVAGALLGLLSRAILYKTERSGDPITFPSDLTGFNDQAELNLFQLGRESRVVADLFSSMSARQSLPSADAILAAIGATVNVSSDANSGIVSLGGKAPLSGFPIVSSASSVSRLENVAMSLTTETDRKSVV